MERVFGLILNFGIGVFFTVFSIQTLKKNSKSEKTESIIISNILMIGCGLIGITHMVVIILGMIFGWFPE